MKSNKKTYRLRNIDCPNCAAKMEAEISKLEGVVSARIDFPSGQLSLNFDGSLSVDKVYPAVQKAVRGIEPGVEVVEPEEKGTVKDDRLKKRLLRLIAGALLYAAALACLMLRQPKAVYVALFILSFLIAGLGIVIKAARNVIKGYAFDESLLMTVATLGAIAIGRFEEGAAVMLFYGAGELMERLASARSVRSIEAAMDMRPDYANLITAQGVRRVSPEDVAVNGMIEVRPGEKIPLDGTVTKGESFVDTKALTGEPVPRRTAPGSEVLAGYVNGSGLLTVRADRAYEASSAAKMLKLIREADGKKARSERFITRFARYYTPAVTAAALLTAVLPPLILSQPFSVWIYRALTLLVVSCPCALVISVPLSVFAGLGAAAKAGILIKGGSHLETMAEAGSVVFDKTGTLTQGVFEVVKLIPARGVTTQRLLETAAAAESGSNHPIAQSVLRAAGGVDRIKPDDFSELSGSGVRAVSDGRTILAGNEALMSSQRVDFERCHETGTLVYVAENGVFLGCIVVADVIKQGSQRAVKRLKALGISKLVMLTGDNEAAALSVGERLGIARVHAGLLPEQKAELLDELENAAEGKIIFAGDGINDAPVLARADVGIAMGGIGSGAAVEAADAVIMDDDPSRIADAIVIARRTRTVIRQNIVFSLSIKLVVLILAAAGLASMWEAVFADVGVALLAILNAARLLIFSRGIE